MADGTGFFGSGSLGGQGASNPVKNGAFVSYEVDYSTTMC
jgi:hypothetical protein